MSSMARRKRASRGSGELLREQIIAVTKDLLAESASSDAVSIRAVADAVGVTSPSIYLHFADKDTLIEAVVADVFAELDVAMLAAAEPATEPLEKLCAFGLAYVEFAIAHPEHYRVATMGLGGEGAQATPLDHVLADAAFTHFMDTVSACMDAGIFAQGDPLPITLELWAAAHGIASLMIAKPFLPWGDGLATANAVLRSAAMGHAVTDLIGGELTPRALGRWLAAERKRAVRGKRS